MKKKLIFTALLIGSGFIAQVSAQTTTTFGIKLNAGVTDLKLSDMPGSSHTFKPSASIGGFTRIELSEHFALQPELMLTYTESSIKYANEKTKFKYAGIEVPVYGLYQRQIGTGKLIAGVGPHIGYGLSADSKVEQISHGEPGENVIEMNHWYAGGGVMAGYEFRNKISLHATYQLSFDISSGKTTSQVRTQTVSLGVGYCF